MMEPYDIIDEHFFNRELIAVWGMICGSSDMDVEGYALSFEGYLVEIEAMLDVSAIGISYEHSRCDFPNDVRPGCSYDEVSDEKPFSNFLGKRLLKWRLLVGESGSESDRYEELLVNPTLLTLAAQRGNIDCGGLEYLIVRYGNFFQFVLPTSWGHVSVCIEKDADPVAIGLKVKSLFKED